MPGPKTTFKGRTLFTDTSFANDSFLSGLGNANVSPIADITQGIDSGIATATNLGNFIDEFGPQGQARKQAQLSNTQAQATLNQRQAQIAQRQIEFENANRVGIAERDRFKLSTELSQAKNQAELNASLADFQDKIIQAQSASDIQAIIAQRPGILSLPEAQGPVVQRARTLLINSTDPNERAALSQLGTDSKNGINLANLESRREANQTRNRELDLRASGQIGGRGGQQQGSGQNLFRGVNRQSLSQLASESGITNPKDVADAARTLRSESGTNESGEEQTTFTIETPNGRVGISPLAAKSLETIRGNSIATGGDLLTPREQRIQRATEGVTAPAQEASQERVAQLNEELLEEAGVDVPALRRVAKAQADAKITQVEERTGKKLTKAQKDRIIQIVTQDVIGKAAGGS